MNKNPCIKGFTYNYRGYSYKVGKEVDGKYHVTISIGGHVVESLLVTQELQKLHYKVAMAGKEGHEE